MRALVMPTWHARPAVDALLQLVQRVALDSIAGFNIVVARMLTADFEPSRSVASWSGPRLLTNDELTYIEVALARAKSLFAPTDERTRAQYGFVTAVTAILRDDPARARALYLDTLARCKAIGDIRGETMTMVGLARATAILGDEAGAEELGEQAAQLARTDTDLSAEAFAANVLAQLAGARGDAERVAQCRADTVRLLLALKKPTFGTASWRPAGLLDLSDPQTGTGEWLSVLGHALADLDRPEQAKACWQQAVATLSQLGHPSTEELRSLVRFG